MEESFIHIISNLYLLLIKIIIAQVDLPLTTLPIPRPFFLLRLPLPMPTANRATSTTSCGEKCSIPVLCIYIYRNAPRKMNYFGGVGAFACLLGGGLSISLILYTGQILRVKLLGHRVHTIKNLLATTKLPMLYLKYSSREYGYEYIGSFQKN